MSVIQDRVLATIKAGHTQKQEIVKETKLNGGTVTNAIKCLRKWGEIETDGNGNYSITKQEE